MPPTVIFGDIRGMEVSDIKPALERYKIKRLDTAAGYVSGDSEKRLGDASMAGDYTIDTKILGAPLDAGALTPEKIEESSIQSLERLRTNQVNVLYCHLPDFKTPLEDQARGFEEVYRKGRFKELGLSNFAPQMVQDWLSISHSTGYIKPTWFQGQYNLLCRTYEETLFPLLRREGMHFAAFSPLGGGFLLGNFKPGADAQGQRFVEHAAKNIYHGFYDRPPMHTAFSKLEQISSKYDKSTNELSLRWLLNHSQLRDDDVIILGASKVRHIEDSLQKIYKGPLDKATVDELNGLWTEDVKVEAKDLVDITKWTF